MNVTLEVGVDRVALITLNRPSRLNAWTPKLHKELWAALDECEANDDVSVMVVTGAGRGFCSGADMDILQGVGNATEERDDELEPRSVMEVHVGRSVDEMDSTHTYTHTRTHAHSCTHVRTHGGEGVGASGLVNATPRSRHPFSPRDPHRH